MNNNILVIGSTNTDMVVKAEHFPAPGETILGGKFLMNPGGEGANQAVAASRLGGQVTFITKVGNDIFGKQALQQFRKESIRTDYAFSDNEHPSGVALITVDQHGENSIVVAPGANAALRPEDLEKAVDEFTRCQLLLMQLEVPLPTVMAAAAHATRHGKRVILNPAPAASLPDELFRQLFVITPNRTEAELLTSIRIDNKTSAEKAADRLLKKGVTHVVITLGAEGAFLANETQRSYIASQSVKAVDTTAAGDVFNGALAVALSEDLPLEEAVAFANRAAAISVTRMGAQSSVPTRQEVDQP